MKLLFIPTLFLFVAPLFAQEQLLSLNAVSENTILLKFDEGEKDLTSFKEYFIYDAPNATYYGEIDQVQALIPSNFEITSPDDPNYDSPINPIATFFKAKEQKGLFEYYVYLRLPSPLVEGASYTVIPTNIGSNESSYEFTFDVFNLFSESVHVNQVGMIASAGKKYAYVSQWLGQSDSTISNFEDFGSLEGTTCHVVRLSDGEIIYTGSGAGGLQFRKEITETGFGGGLANLYWTRSEVWDFDFSSVGNSIETDDDELYKIVVEGVGSSFPFQISNSVYDDIVKLMGVGLYHQRSGIDRGQPYSDFPKPVDHMPGVDGFEITYSNYRRLDNTEGDPESFVQLPAQATDLINPTNPASWMTSPDDFPWGSGGHFDAGDFDIYTDHLMVPLYGALTYVMKPDAFYDGQFDIPESNNDLPDILDEVRWTLDFFRRTKGETGGICGGKETDDYYGPSWNDGSGESSSEQMWYVYREDPAASYVYAAAAAQFALALEISGDPTNEAQLYINEALAAFQWAEENQEAGDAEKLIGGFPAFGDVLDLKLMAASMIYSVTGTQQFLDIYKNETSVTTPTTNLYTFPISDEQFATYAFALIPPDKWGNFDNEAVTLQNIQKEAIINWANVYGLNDQDGYPLRHIANSFDPPIGGATASTPKVFPQIVAYHISEDQEILDNILVSNDINLGGNPDNWVYITGAGQIGAERFSSDPLHEDNWQYGGENIPGMPLYGLWSASSYNFQASPPSSEWPHFECNSNARIYLGHSEFTIHQNTAPVMAIYGYLNGVFNDEILGVPVNAENSEVPSVFPNPTSGSFYVDRTEASFELYDLQGRKINFTSKIEGRTTRISFDILNYGIYLLKIVEGERIVTKKIVLDPDSN